MKAFHVALLAIAICAVPIAPAAGYTYNNLGLAGGWDKVNKSTTVTTVLDASDFTADLPAERVSASLTSAYNTWDNVASAENLNFSFLADPGGNYDVFDGPNDSAGPPWFDGTSATLDQNADWRYANIVLGGWLPEDYFGDPDILAVTWTGKLRGDGSRKWTWHSEVFFNDAWSWVDDAAAADEDLANGLPNRLIDLETVALHELGHTIGLGHEDDVPSVMATYYTGSQRDLFEDDIEGITSLYSEANRGKGGGKGKDKGGPPDKLMLGEIEWHLTGVTYVAGASGAAVVPEPATLALLCVGALAALCRRRR